MQCVHVLLLLLCEIIFGEVMTFASWHMVEIIKPSSSRLALLTPCKQLDAPPVSLEGHKEYESLKCPTRHEQREPVGYSARVIPPWPECIGSS